MAPAADFLYVGRMSEFPPAGFDRLALLATFVRIVEAGSLSAAAAQLGTTQPTVSRRLQTLERALGLRLVRRSTPEMTLTPEGARCLAHARGLVESWERLSTDLRGARDEPEGVLRVVVPHAFGQEHLLGPLQHYLERYPRVSVEWLLHDLRPDFIAQGIDCAIELGRVEDPSLVARPLAAVPRIVVASPALCAARFGGAPGPDHPAALESWPWLAFRTYYRDEVALMRRDDGARHGFAIRPRLSTDNLYALRNAARAGLGAAIVSAWLARADIAAGRLVQLVPEWEAASLAVSLVYPHARFYPARLRRFVEIMRAQVPRVIGAE